MSVLNVLPTLNCVYIGRPDRPLNAPRRAPANVRSYIAQVAELTEPAEIRWQLTPAAPRGDQESLGSSDPIPTVVSCSTDHSSAEQLASDPTRLRQRLRKALDGAMRGRNLHVVPFATGDLLGILVTDHPAMVDSVAEITTIGDEPLERIAAGGYWRTIVHCRGGRDRESYLVRFCDSGETWAYGPGHHARMLLDTDVLIAATA